MPLEGERTPSRPRCSRRMRVYSVCKGCTAPHTPLHPTPGSPWKGKRRLWLQTVPGQSLEPGATPGQEQGQGKAPPAHPRSSMAKGRSPSAESRTPGYSSGCCRLPNPSPSSYRALLVGQVPPLPVRTWGDSGEHPGSHCWDDAGRSTGCLEQLVFLDPRDYKKAVTYLGNPTVL